MFFRQIYKTFLQVHARVIVLPPWPNCIGTIKLSLYIYEDKNNATDVHNGDGESTSKELEVLD